MLPLMLPPEIRFYRANATAVRHQVMIAGLVALAAGVFLQLQALVLFGALSLFFGAMSKNLADAAVLDEMEREEMIDAYYAAQCVDAGVVADVAADDAADPDDDDFDWFAEYGFAADADDDAGVVAGGADGQG